MRLEAGVGGSRTLYVGLSFDHTMSMNLDATGSRATGASKPGASGKYDGKYRYEGPGASESPGSSATVLGAERNSLAVKGHPVAFTTKAGSYYLGQDRLGSTESVSDSAGGIFERLEYDAFGSIVSGDPEAASLWGYAGKRYDPATGSYDYGFRDYAPSQGRFTSVDPIRDGANWYGYCDADPVNYVDLWGLDKNAIITYNRKAETITVEVWDDNKPNRPIRNKTYGPVTNIIVKTMVTYDPDGDRKTINSYNYYPQTFPDTPPEGWKVTRTYESADVKQGPTISTDATRTVTTYDDTGNSIGTVKDTGYADHGGTGLKTWGCLKSSDVDVRERIKTIEEVIKSGGEARYYTTSGGKND
jgi:RHS repeat-associated protein